MKHIKYYEESSGCQNAPTSYPRFQRGALKSLIEAMDNANNLKNQGCEMTSSGVTRRNFIETSLKTAIASPIVFTSASAYSYTNAPNDATVTLGFNVPQTGPYADEGADQLRAMQLAVEHLNGYGDGGLLDTFSSTALNGAGILGRRVEFVTGDTQTKSDAARAAARSMIEKDGAIMIAGGSSSGAAIAVHSLCQEAGIISMAGAVHSKDVTCDDDKKPNGFRYYFNSGHSASALGRALPEVLGTNRRAYHLTGEQRWGYQTQAAFAAATEDRGWQTVSNVVTPLKTTDFSSYLQPLFQQEADVLVLNHQSGSLVNSITDAARVGLLDRLVGGKEIAIVAPHMTDLVAKAAGSHVRGVWSTQNWNWKHEDAGSSAFVRSFGAKYGFPPSSAAHTCYCEVLLYADACQRAGTFAPSGVGEALESFKFEGLGNGRSIFRRNHQAYKDVFVVRGKEQPENPFDLIEIDRVSTNDDDDCDPCTDDDVACTDPTGSFNDGN